MTTGKNAAELEDGQIASLWSIAFLVGGNAVEFERMADLLRPEIGDIYTGRMPRVTNVANAIAEGRLQILGAEDDPIGLNDMLGLIVTIALHSRLARSKTARMAVPGFCVRTEAGIRPAFPLEHLAPICGLSHKRMAAILAPIAQDGVVRMVRDADGNDAAVLNDGFLNDGNTRRFMRY